MKIPEIKASIINKYTNLAKKAHIPQRDNRFIPKWQLRMGDWEVSAYGEAFCKWKRQRFPVFHASEYTIGHLPTSASNTLFYLYAKDRQKSTRISFIIDDNNVIIKKKPIFMSKKWALRKLNKALANIERNFDNGTRVQRSETKPVYTEAYIQFLLGKNPNFEPRQF